MKIIYKQGDITKADERCIVHGCNAQGVMGAGVALAIRRAYPEAYETYINEFKTFGLKLGSVYHSSSRGKLVWHAITQINVGTDRRQVDYEAIFHALETINAIGPRDYDLDAIAFPRIGAGLGGGNWGVISAMIEATSTHYQPVVYDL